MLLCDLCKSLPLDHLPRFPHNYSRTHSGKRHIHVLMLDNSEKGTQHLERFGFPYHPDLESLRKAAAAGCVLSDKTIQIWICQAQGLHIQTVAKEADGLLLEYKSLSPPPPGWYAPDWDMWVTKRGCDTGDGLWVLCRSAKENHRFLSVVASIGFASDEDDPLSAGCTDRVVRELPDQTTLNHIAKWLKKCDQHSNCRAEETRLPTRLLDVGSSTTNTESSRYIKLVELDPGMCCSSSSKYVTLSYCWGPLTTTTETLEARKNGIDIHLLSQTFRDAVSITRMLRVRYLCIDSLCVCQDDLKDWERQSGQMAAIYANSYLTLAAAKSHDAHGVLLSLRRPRAYFKLPRRSGDSSADSSRPESYVLASALPLGKDVIHDNNLRMKEGPLTRRAWGFQERVLARRILHFATDQLYWECLEGFEAEDGLKLPYRLPFVSDNSELVEYTENFAKRSLEKEPWLGQSTKALSKWHGLLWEYGPREMTDPADKLPALSGIARCMISILEDEYLAGLWRRSLVRDLCWESLKCKAPPAGEGRGVGGGGYRVPSWSWASVDGIPAASFLEDEEEDEVARILDAQVQIDGANPFGRVKDAWIKVDSPLVRMRLSENKGPTGHLLFRSEVGGAGIDSDCYGMLDTIDRDYEASAELIKSMEVYALVLAYTYGGGPGGPDPEKKNPRIQGLYVTPALDRPGWMRRIGFVLGGAESFGPDDIASSRAEVTIV